MVRISRKFILASIIILLITITIYQTRQYFTLDNAKVYQQLLTDLISQYFWLAASVYFVSYVVLTALSIPGATVVTLLGAAAFGFWTSLLLVSFASSVGATLAFLMSRYFLRSWVQKRFGDKLLTINQGIERDGAMYLFSLRLIPIFPFFIINLLMGITPITTLRFYWISQIGMLPGTAVYLNAGTQLAQIDSLSGIISPAVLMSMALLGVFPILAKWMITKWKAVTDR
ncbi:Uncharacterized membrane protein YdjX, TVP38/TMEM64 family, SNARE-associated domain [Vibrio xiamenensis]|uniref:TVP38/TMEM64 family membrane protein n=1 Tax=Vibrio xiamenensis TaxID=861298 RepID=A0A1G7Z9J5_9VIBR|nr:TVP38/TMEM64 family protein [Vibrio xiamenensis]SDH05374.1 Uncharacterized membrane protein YdjX, TVP38/TMEM64 family, SNARE-associated domain [Vibrio xiamenensis]